MSKLAKKCRACPSPFGRRWPREARADRAKPQDAKREPDRAKPQDAKREPDRAKPQDAKREPDRAKPQEWMRRQPAGWRRRRGGQIGAPRFRRTDHPGAPAFLEASPYRARASPGCRATPPLRGGECAGVKMNLATINIAAILPTLVLSVVGIVVMVAEPFVGEQKKSNLGWLAFAGTLAAMLSLVPMANNRGQWYSNLWIVDDYDVFLDFIFL